MERKGIDLSTCPRARLVKAICSPAELAFAGTLKQALKSKVLILLKVRILDVLELIEDPLDRKRMFFWRDFLGDIHFDYVVCSKQTLTPLLAVELDHDEPLKRGRATRDVAKTTIAARAQFPLVRISAAATYAPADLRQKLIAEYKRGKAGTLPVEMI
jgi:hypothetical protein